MTQAMLFPSYRTITELSGSLLILFSGAGNGEACPWESAKDYKIESTDGQIDNLTSSILSAQFINYQKEKARW